MGIAKSSSMSDSSPQVFICILDRQLSENGLKGKWFESWRGACESIRYISQLWVSKITVSFGKEL